MEVTYADLEGWDEKTANSSQAEQCCAEKAAMHTLVSLLANCSLEQVGMGASDLAIPQFSKACLLVTNQSSYTETGGVREV